MSLIVVCGLPATAIAGNYLIPVFGWRAMFVIAGVGALIVWYLRKALPESPRWLEAVGRSEEAEALMRTIEREASRDAALPPPAPPRAAAPPPGLAALLTPALLPRLFVGSVVLVVVNTLIFGFVTWLPTFFVQQGLGITKSLAFAMMISLGSPVGCVIGAWSSDWWGRKPTIIGASALAIVFGAIYPFVKDPALLIPAGLCLIVAIYILVATLYGVYTSEIFPTELRLRANGICNFFGRGATIVTPFVVVALFRNYGIGGVLALMIGLLVVQIVVVAVWGVETRKRALEEVAAAEPPAAGAPKPQRAAV
jgi:putative MFS transporter